LGRRRAGGFEVTVERGAEEENVAEERKDPSLRERPGELV